LTFLTSKRYVGYMEKGNFYVDFSFLELFVFELISVMKNVDH